MPQVATLYFNAAFELVLLVAAPVNGALVVFTYAEEDPRGGDGGGVWTVLALSLFLVAFQRAWGLVAVLFSRPGDRVRVQAGRERFIVDRAVHGMVKAEAPGLSEDAVLRENLHKRSFWWGLWESAHMTGRVLYGKSRACLLWAKDLCCPCCHCGEESLRGAVPKSTTPAAQVDSEGAFRV